MFNKRTKYENILFSHYVSNQKPVIKFNVYLPFCLKSKDWYVLKHKTTICIVNLVRSGTPYCSETFVSQFGCLRLFTRQSNNGFYLINGFYIKIINLNAQYSSLSVRRSHHRIGFKYSLTKFSYTFCLIVFITH